MAYNARGKLGFNGGKAVSFILQTYDSDGLVSEYHFEYKDRLLDFIFEKYGDWNLAVGVRQWCEEDVKKWDSEDFSIHKN